MQVITFKPECVCSREMTVEVDDNGVITRAQVIGGCNGNLQGICRLIEGRKLEEVANTLKGIKCMGSRNASTSCPDQMALGIEANLK